MFSVPIEQVIDSDRDACGLLWSDEELLRQHCYPAIVDVGNIVSGCGSR